MDLFGYTPAELASLLKEEGLDPACAPRLAYWIYRRGSRSFAEMHSLPREVKRRLGGKHTLEGTKVLYGSLSADGTKKYLFTGKSGTVEAVYIPDGRRHTLCVSTQVGCRLGCRFCATGQMGYRGNLTAGEIIGQLHALPEKEQVDHIVFMGMGEPLENVEEVMRAIEILTDPRAYAIAVRYITLSTVGMLPALEKVLRETRVNITISLHSPFPEERSRLIPVERRYPFRKVLALLDRYPPEKKRRYTIAYTLFDDLNDSDEHLRELVRVVAPVKAGVNLLPYHPVEGLPFRPASPDRLHTFCDMIRDAGIRCTIRRSRGEEIAAACGLLAGKR